MLGLNMAWLKYKGTVFDLLISSGYWLPTMSEVGFLMVQPVSDVIQYIKIVITCPVIYNNISLIFKSIHKLPQTLKANFGE